MNCLFYPSATSSAIISVKPRENISTPMFECSPEDISGISSSTTINGNYLARVFKRETGHTLLWYHNAVRCEKAKRLLLETDLSVSEVGAAVGYVSSAHFSHLFKKMTGHAPSDWRGPAGESFQEPIDFTGMM